MKLLEMNKHLTFLVVLVHIFTLLKAEARACQIKPTIEIKIKIFVEFSAYFIEKCYRDDPDVDECLKYSGNKLASYLHEGIPELGLDEVEPTVLDEISITLGEGPDAYRAVFSNIEAYGVSNISLARVRSDIDTYQFQLTYEIPRIKVRSNFRSSGVL